MLDARPSPVRHTWHLLGGRGEALLCLLVAQAKLNHGPKLVLGPKVEG